MPLIDTAIRSAKPKGFSVETEGAAKSIDDLKAAVAAVAPDRLEGFAHR